jgi:hypothetical protein
MENVLYVLSHAALACFDAGWWVSSVMYENPRWTSTVLISRAKHDPMDAIRVDLVILRPASGGIG